MKTMYYLKNAQIVNEGRIFFGNILIKDGIIEKIFDNSRENIDVNEKKYTVIDVNRAYLLPGIIDDQVHYREPGLTSKADIYTESKAAVAGDRVVVTSVSSKTVLTSQTTGASSSVNVNASSDVEVVLGLSTTIVNGLAAGIVALLVNYINGIQKAGLSRSIEMIQNIPEGKEFIVYGLAATAPCRVRMKMAQVVQ